MFAKTLCAVVGLGVASLIAQPVSAEVVTFDFTSTNYADANNNNSFNTDADGFGVTLQALPGDQDTLTFNATSEIFGQTRSLNGQDLVLRGDGIGVASRMAGDEIDTGESVLVTFERAVDVVGIAVLDLFKKNDDPDDSTAEQVTMTFTFDGGSPLIWNVGATLSAAANEGGFYAFENLDFKNVVSIEFSAANSSEFFDDSNNDFALAAIQAVVPEPATWLMMLGGFAFAGMALKRRGAAIAVA